MGFKMLPPPPLKNAVFEKQIIAETGGRKLKGPTLRLYRKQFWAFIHSR